MLSIAFAHKQLNERGLDAFYPTKIYTYTIEATPVLITAVLMNLDSPPVHCAVGLCLHYLNVTA